MTDVLWVAGGAVCVNLDGPRIDGDVRIELARDQTTFTFAVTARDWRDLIDAIGRRFETHAAPDFEPDSVEARTYGGDAYVLANPAHAKHFTVGTTWHWCSHGLLRRAGLCAAPGSFAGRVTRVDQYHGVVTIERIEQ